MTARLDWTDFWSIYTENPEALQKEVDTMPEFLRGKSTRVQIEIMKHAPKTVIHKLINSLTIDCQLALLR